MEKDSERATDESRSNLVMEGSVQRNTVRRDYRFTTKKNIVFYIHQFPSQGYVVISAELKENKNGDTFNTAQRANI